MSERDRIARVLPEGLAAALTAQSRAGATGTLLTTGDPGGLLRLDDGRVAGVESSGAPGVEALLLRSGRVLEASWVAAYQAGAAHGHLAVELVRRGLIGAAELEAVCLMALFDAAFAIAAGSVEECGWQPDPPSGPPGPLGSFGSPDGYLPAEYGPVGYQFPDEGLSGHDTSGYGTSGGTRPGGQEGREPWTREVARVDAAQLCAETERRLVALAELPAPVRPGRDRLAAVTDPAAPGAAGGGRDGAGSWNGGGSWSGAGIRAASGLRREVLGLADGRRTARDIAFTLGRGVYPVTVEASRLLADGLLRVGTPSQAGGEVRALLAPRHAAPPPGAGAGASGSGAGASGGSGGQPLTGPVHLPRRPSRASRS